MLFSLQFKPNIDHFLVERLGQVKHLNLVKCHSALLKPPLPLNPQYDYLRSFPTPKKHSRENLDQKFLSFWGINEHFSFNHLSNNGKARPIATTHPQPTIPLFARSVSFISLRWNLRLTGNLPVTEINSRCRR